MPSTFLRGIVLRLLPALAVLLVLTGCANISRSEADASPGLTIYAAASLKDLFEAVALDFAAEHPGVEISFNFGGSQQLARQLAEGAPGDLFASANLRQMQAVVEAGRVVEGSARLFAGNRLVVISPEDNPAQVTQLADLAKAGLKLVIASESVPAGEYALQFVKKAAADPAFPPRFRDAVLANIVSYEDNVRSVLNKVALGEADAGIVYSSDVAQPAQAQVRTVEIPAALNVVAEYPAAVLSDSAQRELAQAFVDQLLSERGQQRVVEFGFEPVAAARP